MRQPSHFYTVHFKTQTPRDPAAQFMNPTVLDLREYRYLSTAKAAVTRRLKALSAEGFNWARTDSEDGFVTYTVSGYREGLNGDLHLTRLGKFQFRITFWDRNEDDEVVRVDRTSEYRYRG